MRSTFPSLARPILTTAVAVLFAVCAAVAEPLTPGDLVTVKVYRHGDLSSSTQLDGNGNIELPYIGNVNVAGLTEAEATARVEQGLRSILKNPRVKVSRAGGAITPIGGQRTEQMKTEVVALNNADAETLFNALIGMSTEGGTVNFDPATNALIVTDTPATLQNMKAVIQTLDQMQSQITQVHIESRIVEVESTAIKDIGIRWFAVGDQLAGGYTPNAAQSARVNALRGSRDPAANERISNTNNNAGGNNQGAGRRFVNNNDFMRRLQVPVQLATPGQMFFGFFNSGIDLGAFLDALIADNRAEMLASPYVRTVNHQPAEIRMTEEFPFTELSTAGFSSTANVRFLDIGIILEVTPHVRRDPDGVPYIQLELAPEVSTATGTSNGVPVRSVRSTRTTSNVRDGQTLVIGGIRESDTQNIEQKVPVIGNWPVIGRLFRRNERAKTATELMIFVTPTIHERPEEMGIDRVLSAPDAEATLASVQEAAVGEQRKD